MKTEVYKCDIKDCENNPQKKGFKIQVIFTTDQTEGRSCEPYLSDETIDICKSCLDKVLKGNYIFASGAMGYNTYILNENNR